jgi:hypothetical protein
MRSIGDFDVVGLEISFRRNVRSGQHTPMNTVTDDRCSIDRLYWTAPGLSRDRETRFTTFNISRATRAKLPRSFFGWSGSAGRLREARGASSSARHRNPRSPRPLAGRRHIKPDRVATMFTVKWVVRGKETAEGGTKDLRPLTGRAAARLRAGAAGGWRGVQSGLTGSAEPSLA